MSKARLLTMLLRHKAPEYMEVDNKGFVDTYKVIQWINNTDTERSTDTKFTMEHLEQIVLDDNKGRFQWNSDKSKIRAVQGHSFDIKVEYEPYEPCGMPLHFTYSRNTSRIKEKGLLPMQRQYIHMVEYVDESKKPWHLVRQDCDMVITVQPEYIKTGKFYMADNGVLLHDGAIPPDMLIFLPLMNCACSGFIIKRLSRQEDEYLVVRTPRGHLSYPKGKRKKGENSLACAFRELTEETGLTQHDIIIQPGFSREDSNNGKVSILYYHAILKPEHSGVCVPEDPNELEECCWMNIDQLKSTSDMLDKRKALL